MKRKTGDKTTLAWLWAVAKGKKRFVGLLFLVQVILGVSGTGYALFLRGLVNQAVKRDMGGFRGYVLLLAGLVVLQFILRSLSRFLEEYSRASLENALKQRLFRQLLTKDYASVTATHSGEWLNRLTSDTVVVADGMSQILPGVGGTVVRMVSTMTLLVAFVPGFGIGFVLGGMAVVAMTWGLRRVLKRLHIRVQESDGKLRVFLSERLSSMMIIRAFSQEQTALNQSDELMGAHKAARMRKIRVSNLFHNGFSLVINAVYVFGAVYCGQGILQGTMDYGTFTAVLQLVGQANLPLANMSGYFPKYSAMLASAERLMAVEEFAQETMEAEHQGVATFYRDSFEGLGLRGAGFTYLTVTEQETRRKVLRDLDLEIQKGQYVAFCGPSGCGKSTVLKLLMCLYPLDEGQRYVASREGEMPLTAGWRDLFAYVPQGNQLMSGTIREVVTFAKREDMVKEEQIRRALTIACADQFISELPDGLDTQLGERGAGLSEGQMQRIAIARAIFSDRPVLLLDEATSALDEDTEARLLNNLRSMTDKTVIIVTHRPAALDITDKVINFVPTED